MVDGFYLRFGDEPSAAANGAVHRLLGALLAERPPGVTDLVPGYSSLYVEYDSSILSRRMAWRWARRIAEAQPGDPPDPDRPHPRLIEIPVVYDGEDLASVAAYSGVSPRRLARIHSSVDYRVFAIGFTPGFPFLAEVPESIRSTRRPVPRKSVPAHSVAVAGRQSGIYPLPSPGGWQLLGHALEAVYDPLREDPFLVRPGDAIRFRAVDAGTAPPTPGVRQLLPVEPRLPMARVLAPGLLDLVVDGGRRLSGRYGLARSGPADPVSARIANGLLSNSPDAPLLEINLLGPVLQILRDAVLSWAGWGPLLLVDGTAVPPFASFAVKRGAVLEFRPGRSGVRSYLALPGGIESAAFRGSASVDVRARIGAPLAAGVVLGANSGRGIRPGRSFVPPAPSGVTRLRLLPGPQWTSEAAQVLARAEYRVTSGDRMGLRLDGAALPGGEVVSEAVPLGALQVSPGGSPMLLLNDRGTLGGYAKPAIVHPGDLHKAGRLGSGARIRFRWSRDGDG